MPDHDKTAFNKENAPELLGQLLRVLKSQGMDDSMAAIKRCGLTKKLNDEWMDDTRNRQKRKRDRRAARLDRNLVKFWERRVKRYSYGWDNPKEWLDAAHEAAVDWYVEDNRKGGYKKAPYAADEVLELAEVFSEEVAPDLVKITQRDHLASAARVAAAHVAKKNYSLTDFLRAAIDTDEAISKAYLKSVSLKSMWDTFEEIPPKQRRMYDDNMRVMSLLRKAGDEAYQTRMTLKRYR